MKKPRTLVAAGAQRLKSDRFRTETALGDRIERDAGAGPVNPWGDAAPQAREPMLRLPWPPALIAVVLIALYALQSVQPDPDGLALQFGFAPIRLLQGGWYGLFTAMFVHGSWSHVLINAVFCVAFGAGVARRFGTGPGGGLLFLLFFLVCGLCGNLGYALVHPHGADPVVGASGAIAGFYAATSRIMGGRKLAALTATPVVVMGAAWIVGNLVIGLLRINAGFGSTAPVAWEAHIAGYVAGLLLIGMFDRAAPGAPFQRRKD